MTMVAILPEPTGQGDLKYRAVAGQHQTLAASAGAALDALAAQLPPDQTGTMVIVQNQRPDSFFTAEQQERLKVLMARWRAARDTGTALSPADQAELDTLVEVEVQAAGKRAAALMASMTDPGR